MFIVAACNPYRANSLAALDKEQWTTGAYYVRPLHPTLELLMWDYGALEPSQERQYIFAKMKMTHAHADAESGLLTDLIAKSQELMRAFAAEHLEQVCNFKKEEAHTRAKSSVSQRDIQRVFRFYKWLLNSFTELESYQADKNLTKNLRALYISLAIVYYFRLNKKFRDDYAQVMSTLGSEEARNYLEKEALEEHEDASEQPNIFIHVLKKELDRLTDNIRYPPRIARTQALKENIYAIIICSMTRTPLIIVGPPGSSKTLSYKIVIENLQGQASPREMFRKDIFHALEPRVYQCSRQSTSKEIEAVFKVATNSQRQYTKAGVNTYTIVMMDEAGLPEESHESLKALHYHLDRREVSFLAISNHILDAAKSNRAVCLFRPEFSESEVIELAYGCLAENEATNERLHIGKLVEGFSDSYLMLMKQDSFNCRFGLRDFIYFLTYLQRRRSAKEAITPEIVMNALERNFNSSEDFREICNTFLKKVIAFVCTQSNAYYLTYSTTK